MLKFKKLTPKEFIQSLKEEYYTPLSDQKLAVTSRDKIEHYIYGNVRPELSKGSIRYGIIESLLGFHERNELTIEMLDEFRQGFEMKMRDFAVMIEHNNSIPANYGNRI